MTKTTIRIDLDSQLNFWVRKSGRHWAFDSYQEAKSYAEQLLAEAQGEALIVDGTDPVRRADA